MSSLKSRAKKIIPGIFWRPASNFYWWWRNRGRHVLAGALDRDLGRSKKRIIQYKDRYRGKRCFILGNGPSLRELDLQKLRGEITFGLNRIYLLYPELGFQTTFLVSVNDLVIQQCADEMAQLDLPKFITWRGRKHLREDARVIFIDSDFTQPENFTTDAAGRIYEGCTVTYVAMQLAFYMGFNPVYIIGVDHNFATKGSPNEVVVSQGADQNHFHPDYFGKGFKWQLPDYECSERAYKMARKTYEHHGRTILDATLGGKLSIFEKTDYGSLF